MERRNFLKTVTSSTLALGVSPLVTSAFADNRVAQSPVTGTTTNPDPVLLKDTSFYWVRGFNYQPGYTQSTGGCDDGSSWSIWNNLKTDLIEKELSRGLELFPEMTAIRIWLPYHVYLAQPGKFLKDFSNYLKVIEKLKLKVMVVLFNAWGGNPFFGGFRPKVFARLSKEELDQTFHYVDTLIERHGDNPTIFSWDLCNEPDLYKSLDVYFPWLERMYKHIKDRKEKTCLTISYCLVESREQKLAPICDLLSVHPYYWPLYSKTPEDYRKKVNKAIQAANEAGKPMLASEIGWSDGGEDDIRRMELLNVELTAMTESKMGFTIHALNHSLVADLHRAEYGPVNEAGYMACIEKDGSLRKGHEKIREYLKAK
jgi:hypothetical protein